MANKNVWKGYYRPNVFNPDNEREQLLDIESAGTVRDADLADDIIAEGIEIKKETMIDLFARRESALKKRLLAGYSFASGLAVMQPRVSGVFADTHTQFDPAVNKCNIDMNPSSALREELKDVSVKVLGTKESGGAKIGAVCNSYTGAKDGTVPIGDDVIIEGDKIKVLDTEDTAQGVFFIDEAGEEHRVTRKLTENRPSKIIARVPADVPAGKVQLVIRTKFTGSSTTLKNVRTITYAYDLTAVKI